MASQVLGPFLLTARLLPTLRSNGPARVLTMSSGGMYSAGLAVDPTKTARWSALSAGPAITRPPMPATQSGLQCAEPVEARAWLVAAMTEDFRRRASETSVPGLGAGTAAAALSLKA